MIQPAPADDLKLEIRRQFSVTPERLFQVWTTPEHLEKWLCPTKQYAMTVLEYDLTINGRYQLEYRDAETNTASIVGGTFQKIEPPEKLVFTWCWEPPDPDAGVESLVTVTFHKIEIGTELVLLHERFPNQEKFDRHIAGWNGALDHLTIFLK